MKPQSFAEFLAPSPGAIAASVPKPPALVLIEQDRDKLLVRIEAVGRELQGSYGDHKTVDHARTAALQTEFATLKKLKADMRANLAQLRSEYGEAVERALHPIVQSDARETLRLLMGVQSGLRRIQEAQTAIARAGGDGRQFGIHGALYELEALLRGLS